MAINGFLPWGDSAGNIMNEADYEASQQRTDGVELGLADPALHNKLYRQVTIMAAALGQVIADSGLDATDGSMAALIDAIKRVFLSDPEEVIPITRGGTGSTTAADARAQLGITPANIGAAEKAHKHAAEDINSGAIPIAHGGTGSTTAADARAQLDIQEWRAGDVFSLTWGVYLGGIVTSGGKECAITVPLGAPIRAKSVAVAGNVILRGNQGYLDNMDSGKGIPLSGGDFTGTAQVISAKAGLVKITIMKESAAFGNVTNNTPIMMGTATTPQLKITFS